MTRSLIRNKGKGLLSTADSKVGPRGISKKAHLLGTLRDGCRGSRSRASLSEGGGQERDTNLVKSVSLYQCTSLSIGAPLWYLEGGSFTRDFER